MRTLVFAYKPLTQQDVDTFLDAYNAVLGDLLERQKKEAKKPNRIDDVMAQMESQLLLQGATANEDKLQEDVPETIALLAEAGIKFYMLTGTAQWIHLMPVVGCQSLCHCLSLPVIGCQSLLVSLPLAVIVLLLSPLLLPCLRIGSGDVVAK